MCFYAEYSYDDNPHTECNEMSVIMISVIMLSVIMPSVFKLSVVAPKYLSERKIETNRMSLWHSTFYKRPNIGSEILFTSVHLFILLINYIIIILIDYTIIFHFKNSGPSYPKTEHSLSWQHLCHQ